MLHSTLMFVSGTFFGVFLALLYGAYQLKKLENIKKTLINKIREKAEEARQQSFDSEEKKNSIRERLMEAVKLTEEQLALRAQAEQPSKNSLHSRHKNGLIYQMREIEKKRLQLLRSILKDGFDPTVSITREGGATEEISLSAYLAQVDSTDLDEPAANSPDGPRKAGKFVIYKGGKDDGETSH